MAIHRGINTTTVEFGRGETTVVTSTLHEMDSEAVMGNVAIREGSSAGAHEYRYMPEDYPVHLYFSDIASVEQLMASLQTLRDEMAAVSVETS